jgi:GNAT superfamily N-acetyltransferase
VIPLAQVRPEEIAAAWNSVAGAKYSLGPALIEQNLLSSPLFNAEASVWRNGEFVAIKRSAASLYQGPDPATAHLSLFVTSESTELLDQALESLKAAGIKSLVVGTDSGHFLPGAPKELLWMKTWLERADFTPGGEAVDLERDLSDYEFAVPDLGSEHRTLTESDVPLLELFLRREFPGRWHYDVMRKVSAEGPSPVFGLFLGGECEGFALLQGEGCRLPKGGAAWQNSLGPSWGSLGPIGISKALRGKGHGNALLGAALNELRDRGSRQSIIDWTGLADFYGAHGFKVTRRYRSYRREL